MAAERSRMKGELMPFNCFRKTRHFVFPAQSRPCKRTLIFAETKKEERPGARYCVAARGRETLPARRRREIN